MRHVDTVEEHRQLSGVELHAQRVVLERRKPKPALLEALVREDEAAVVPCEDLHAVALLRDENEQVPGEDVLLPRVLNQRHEPVDAVAHVHRLRRQENPYGSREQKHLSPERREQLGQVSGIGPDGEPDDDASARPGLDDVDVSCPRLRRGRGYDLNWQKAC